MPKPLRNEKTQASRRLREGDHIAKCATLDPGRASEHGRRERVCGSLLSCRTGFIVTIAAHGGLRWSGRVIGSAVRDE